MNQSISSVPPKAVKALAHLLPKLPKGTYYVGWPKEANSKGDGGSFEIEKLLAVEITAALRKTQSHSRILDFQDAVEPLQANGLLGIDALGVAPDKAIGTLLGATMLVETHFKKCDNSLCINIDITDSKLEKTRQVVTNGSVPNVSSKPESSRPVRDDKAAVYLPGVGGVGQPTCHSCPAPRMSMDQLSTGKVSVVVTVGPNGRVASAQIVGGSSEELIRLVKTNTLRTVENWVLAPATGPDGKPAAVRMSVEFNFHRSDFRGLNSVPIHH